NYSAAYLHHLFRCEELLAYRLATIHNLHFMQKLIEQCRQAIDANTFSEFKRSFLKSYKTTNEDRRIEQKAAALKDKKSIEFRKKISKLEPNDR
ncbi:MAG: tRNA-guanine transglycosylase, partial [Dehalococcoidia bacterium]|nr:tRNA-guanine transglycosylase [Dehalococcoidia bacterium]